MVAPAMAMLPRGAGDSVLVIPGFRTNDYDMLLLRRSIRGLGYFVHGWRLGQNNGPTGAVLDGMSTRLQRLHARTRQPISIIGVSLGGLYARWLAREAPDAVRQVITLGSPLQMRQGDSTSVESLVEVAAREWDARVWPITTRERDRGPLPVPSTAIYTRTDGIIPWQATIDIADDHHENVRVYSSHVGLLSSFPVMAVIADRLAQPPGGWRPFAPPLHLRPLFPRAASGLEPVPYWPPSGARYLLNGDQQPVGSPR